ncbi:hypothetical protein MMC28_006224, partial [Mycoblastus sanguinarius]|nr:hypothetical protein [Mycoblastus sanguinarius]
MAGYNLQAPSRLSISHLAAVSTLPDHSVELPFIVFIIVFALLDTFVLSGLIDTFHQRQLQQRRLQADRIWDEEA